MEGDFSDFEVCSSDEEWYEPWEEEEEEEEGAAMEDCSGRVYPPWTTVSEALRKVVPRDCVLAMHAVKRALDRGVIDEHVQAFIVYFNEYKNFLECEKQTWFHEGCIDCSQSALALFLGKG